VRQNSITNAVALYTSVVGDVATKTKELEDIAYSVINIARIFEKYSAGDIDAELNKQIEETFTVT
jgi:NTP pyrophosphatase (non-canonical NTP hydrolase)